MVTANQCATNDMGQLCVSQIFGSMNSLESTFSDCAAAVSPGSATCPSQCSTALQSLRTDLGCCINSVFNVSLEGGSSLTAAIAQFAPYFSSMLWETCGVDTVGECSDVPSFTPGSRVPPCTDIEAFENALAYQCVQENVQPVLDAVSSNGSCEFYTTSLVNGCGRNSDGEFCANDILANPTTGSTLLQTVFTNCFSFLTTPQTCPSNCRTSIEQFRDNSGCCVNNLYNTSISASSPTAALPTSAALWSVCGVTSPGFCPSTLMAGAGGSASSDKAFGVMLIAVAAMVIKFIF